MTRERCALPAHPDDARIRERPSGSARVRADAQALILRHVFGGVFACHRNDDVAGSRAECQTVFARERNCAIARERRTARAQLFEVPAPGRREAFGGERQPTRESARATRSSSQRITGSSTVAGGHRMQRRADVESLAVRGADVAHADGVESTAIGATPTRLGRSDGAGLARGGGDRGRTHEKVVRRDRRGVDGGTRDSRRSVGRGWTNTHFLRRVWTNPGRGRVVHESTVSDHEFTNAAASA